MGNSFSNESFEIANIIEILVDGQTDQLREVLKNKMKTDLLNKIIYEKDEMGRTPLHKLCHYGHANLLRVLIKASEDKVIIPLDFNLKDEQGDTCLSLAMSRCYWAESELSSKQIYYQKREEVLNLLLPLTNLTFCVKSKINNPLHWCVFYGDQVNGLKLFNERPSLILETNQHHQSPIELLFEKQIKLGFYKESVNLVKKLCLGFARWVIDFLKEPKSSNKIFSSDSITNKFFNFLLEVKDVINRADEADKNAGRE